MSDTRQSAVRPIPEILNRFMRNYTTDNLVGITPDAFKKTIDTYLAVDDYVSEGLLTPDNQRDQMIKFVWGHNHDFGSFAIRGAMGDRHIGVMSHFIKNDALAFDLDGKKVMEIGAWTGGMSMILAAMGASVTTIEEVRKYADCINFLSESFNLDVVAYGQSLYRIEELHLQSLQDVVLMSGVLYHVTDMVMALRVCFDQLKIGGRCLIESSIVENGITYSGPRVVTSGSKDKRNRTGWCWFTPSTAAIKAMMEDVGFSNVRVKPTGDGRAIAWADKVSEYPMCLAGVNL